MKNWLKNNWFKLLAVIFLVGALGEWPYAYYQFLRWIVFGASSYTAYLAYKSKKMIWAWVFGIMAVLFNPIAPFYLSRATWQPIDFISAIIFFISLFTIYERKN